MAQANKIEAMTAQKYLEEVRKARRQGQRQLAWAHLKSGQALDPEGRVVGLALEEADLLTTEGRPEAAREVLLIAYRQHPKNPWTLRGLADLAHRTGDTDTAWRYLKQAQALDPEGRMAVLSLLEADLLIVEKRLPEAEALLEQMTQAHPENVWGYLRLATVRRALHGVESEYASLKQALALRPGDMTIELRLVEIDLAANAWPAAADRLEALYAKQGPEPRVLLPLLRCYRRMGAAKQEEETLLALIAAHPEHPGALRYLFDTRASDIPVDEVNDLIELARSKVGEAVAEDLRLGVLVRTSAFAEAMALIRRVKRPRRSLNEARMLVQVLFGTYQFRLGLRYLTFCLRRWPEDMGLLDIFVIRGLKQGQVQAVTRWLDALSARMPEAALLGQRLMVHGFSGDLDGTLDLYEQLYARGQVTPVQRETMAKLIYSKQDPSRAQDLTERIGRPMEELDRPLHRGGLAGLMTLEFQMESIDHADAESIGDLKDWLQRRPHSPMPAIRIIDGWLQTQGGPETEPDTETKPETEPGAQGAYIPRQIFQYWSQAEMPPGIETMVNGWRQVAGFEHRLFDRRAAQVFLRKMFDPLVVRAFGLAASPAEEADLLRLCVLARLGGIWIDADDALYGSLSRVIGQGRGLITYREPLGGAIGNNVIAAPPGHPVIMEALRVACAALSRRDNETAWNKTGPGVLTRALGHYLVDADQQATPKDVTVLEWNHLAREIATNNPVGYKQAAGYWNKAGQRQAGSRFWDHWKQAVAEAER